MIVNLVSAENGYYFSLPTRIFLLSRVKMVNYKVTVSTGYLAGATTLNNVFIKLVGTDGESERKWLMGIKGASSFMKGMVSLKIPLFV